MITYGILAITVFVSYLAFQNPTLKQRFMFNPFVIKNRNEWYRFATHGFIHADWMHLLFNAFVLYSFGVVVESDFVRMFGETKGLINFCLLYLGGLLVSCFYSYAQNQNNPHYNSLGASGAVSGVLYAHIAMHPMATLYIMGILPLPGILLGVLYLVYSNYMAKKQIDNIGHDAHFWGAVFGFVVTFVFEPSLMGEFIDQIVKAVT